MIKYQMSFGKQSGIEPVIELTPRERRYQRTHQAIIDAARQIIREAGVDNLSMRAIAERIDYSPAGLYEYFGSKEEIVGAVCEQNFERLAQRLAEVDTTLSPADYMLELGLAYIDFAVRNPDSFLLMFTTVPLSRTETNESRSFNGESMLGEGTAFGILVQGVQRGVDEGIYHETAGFGVLEMAYAAWAQVHGLAMLHITNSQLLPLDYTVLERHTLHAFGKGLAESKR
jgi:AcrR family transcriptional regulator